MRMASHPGAKAGRQGPNGGKFRQNPRRPKGRESIRDKAIKAASLFLNIYCQSLPCKLAELCFAGHA
ncbi:hypothetical protein BCAR13_1190017 [Paraburkholderia caribensis]|nr:hypothetical protein BCAR13_1190017 [Paraburkholderia caribensis]